MITSILLQNNAERHLLAQGFSMTTMTYILLERGKKNRAELHLCKNTNRYLI